MLFGWFISIYFKSLFIFFMWDVIFYLCPLLQEHIWGIQQAVGVNGYKLLLFSAVVAA